MKKIKIIALILSLILATALFSACQDTNNNSQQSQTQEDTSKEDITSKVLVVGTNAEFPPFEFINDKEIGRASCRERV